MFEMVPFRKNNGLTKRGDYFNNLFDEFFNDDFLPTSFKNNGFNVDVKETDDAYLVEADLPGMKKDAINLEYKEGYLTISAKRDDVVEDKKDSYVRRERRYGEFKRSFYVDNIEKDKINASFNDGVLKITLPKNEKATPDTTKIDIH